MNQYWCTMVACIPCGKTFGIFQTICPTCGKRVGFEAVKVERVKVWWKPWTWNKVKVLEIRNMEG